MNMIKTTLATALSLGIATTGHAETEEIVKGPYKISITENGEFGMPNYSYQFTINRGTSQLLGKTSDSTIQAWVINKNALRYNEQTNTLWVIYEQAMDGLDDREIRLAKISQSGIEEVVATYNPLERADSLKIKELPKNWNRMEAEGILKYAVGPSLGQEIVVSIDKNNTPTVKPEANGNNSPKNVIEPSPQVGATNTDREGAQQQKKREVIHSIEW